MNLSSIFDKKKVGLKCIQPLEPWHSSHFITKLDVRKKAMTHRYFIMQLCSTNNQAFVRPIFSSNLKKRTLPWVLRHIPSKTNLFLLRICLKTHGKVRFLELELNQWFFTTIDCKNIGKCVRSRRLEIHNLYNKKILKMGSYIIK